MEQNFIEEKPDVRAKTSRRMRYEAEARMIQRQLGTLDEIKERLGVSGHKLCKMLLIDPSAWSRWNKQGEAPPYVYRALQWFTLLEEKYPGLGPQTFLVDTGGLQAKAEIEKEVQKRLESEAFLKEELLELRNLQKQSKAEFLEEGMKLKKKINYLLGSLFLLTAIILIQWLYLL